MKKLLLLVMLLASLAFPQAANVHVVDTLYGADGTTPFTGFLTVQFPTFTLSGAPNSTHVMNIYVQGGVLDVYLWPSQDAITADNIRGFVYQVMASTPSGPIVQQWYVPSRLINTTTNLAGVRAANSGGSAGATSYSALTDQMPLTQTSTMLTLCAAATAATPCRVKVNANPPVTYQYVSPITVTVTGGTVNSGTAYICVTGAGAIQFVNNFTGTTFTYTGGITGATGTSCGANGTLWSPTMTSNVFNTLTAAMDQRSGLDYTPSYTGGTGIVVSANSVAVDTTVTPQYDNTGTYTIGQCPTVSIASPLKLGTSSACGGGAAAAKAVSLPYTLLSTDGPIIVNAGNDGGTLTIPQATGSFAGYNGSIYYTCAYPSTSGHQITLSTTTSVFNVANVNSSTSLLNCGYETSLRAVGGNWILGNLPIASVATDSGYTITWSRNLASFGAVTANNFQTQNNCASAAAPAACGSAPVGRVVIAAGATTVQVNTSIVTAASEIFVSEDQSLGTALSVTCNTQALTTLGAPRTSLRTAGTSFTISIDVAPTTNPMCISYNIVN